MEGESLTAHADATILMYRKPPFPGGTSSHHILSTETKRFKTEGKLPHSFPTVLTSIYQFSSVLKRGDLVFQLCVPERLPWKDSVKSTVEQNQSF